MEGLFSSRAFTGFGPSRLDPSAEPPALHFVQASRPAGLRQKMRQLCPRRPGVYGMVDDNGQLLYVGKAKCLRTRLLSYFRRKGRDPRAGKILQHARTLVWEYASSEFAALLRELELIQRWRPRLNVKDQPQRQRRVYVCLGRRPAPYVFLTSRPSSRVLGCYGPIPLCRLGREAVRRVNDLFLLRDCPQAQEMVFAEQRELFPLALAAGCVRHEIGTCLGPCAAACTHAEYTAQLRATRAFLEGTETAVLAALEQAMTEAAAGMQFERAAALRDKLEALGWLQQHLERLRLARERFSFVYPVAGHGGKDWWYLIHQGRVAAATPVPWDEVSRRAAATCLEAVYRPTPGRPQPTTLNEIDGVLLVMAWFRKHPDELAATFSPEQIRVQCLSGKPQV